jgi:transposase-like protein
MLSGETVKDLVAELGISDHTLYRWRGQALVERTTGFEPATPTLARLCSTN